VKEKFVMVTNNLTEGRQLNTQSSATATSRVAAGNRLSDEQMFAAYRETGDQQTFAQLIGRYERELFNYLRRYLGNAAQAEDAFQATFMQVHLKSHMFDGSRRFRPWLYTIATNQAIDLQRRNRRHRLVSLDRPQGSENAEVGSLLDLLQTGDSTPLERLDLRERVEWVREAVASLPEQLATAVQLIYFRGLKYREAADELAVPVGTVKSRLHAAVQRLGEAWRNDEAK
jgi:RNA polymerase sigma-70 factor (ECF subfamily)